MSVDRSLPLFAYGTLMFAEVISAVIGRVPAGLSADIFGYKNCCVKERSFPGLLHVGDGSVTGLLYPELSLGEWEKLDNFEDDFYRLQKVMVTAGSRSRPALAYVVPPEHADVLTPETWDPATFRRDFLARYLAGSITLWKSSEL